MAETRAELGRDGLGGDELGEELRDTYFTPLTALSAALGLALFAASGHTSSWFAWTPQSAATAACIGGFYLAGAAVFGNASFGTTWGEVRLAAVLPVVQVALTAVATFAGRDELAGDGPVATATTQAAAAIWQVFHYVTPILLAGALVYLVRGQAHASPRTVPLPRWAQVPLALHGAGVAVIGGTLFVAPSVATSWINWPLSSLDTRAIAAWLLTLGLAEIFAALENDLARLSGGVWGLIVAGLAGVTVFVRYPALITDAKQGTPLSSILTTPNLLTAPQTAGYLLVVGSWLGIATIGFVLIRRLNAVEATPAGRHTQVK